MIMEKCKAENLIDLNQASYEALENVTPVTSKRKSWANRVRKSNAAQVGAIQMQDVSRNSRTWTKAT